MKITYLLPELKWGGAEKHVIYLAAGLRQRGHEAQIVCLFREGPLAGEAREKEIPLTCLHLPYQWNAGVFFQIHRWLRSHPTDLLHTYLFGFHLFGGLPARLLKIPAILSSRREISQWQKGRHRWLENLGNLFTDRIVCCSKAVAEWTLAKERVRPDKVVTIHNGVDLGRFRPLKDHSHTRQSLGIPAQAPVIGTVANLSREKGYPTLLEAAEQILKKVPEAWFLFVGFGPLERDIREKAARIPGHDRIIFAGARTNVPDLIATMNLFVLASEIEGFPNVLLEALAMAKPVVATHVGGVPELIESGRNGLLVPPRDGLALAEAVLALLKDPERARQLASRGETRIHKHFTLDRMTNQYESLYLSLLRQGGKGQAEKQEAVLSV